MDVAWGCDCTNRSLERNPLTVLPDGLFDPLTALIELLVPIHLAIVFYFSFVMT